MEPWESLPDVQPVQNKQSWEDLPDVAPTQTAPTRAPPSPVVAPMGTNATPDSVSPPMLGMPKPRVQGTIKGVPGGTMPTPEQATLNQNFTSNLGATAGGVLSDVGEAAIPSNAVGLLEKRVIDPYVIKPLQENVGVPIADALAKHYDKPNDPSKYLARIITIPIAGSDQFKHYVDTPEGLKDVNQLESKLGTFHVPIFGDVDGTAYLSGVVRFAGDAPLFLISPKASGDALMDAMGAGAGFGLASPEMSMNEGMIGAGVLHTGTSAIAKGVSNLIQAAKGAIGKRAIGVVPPEATDLLGDTLKSIGRPPRGSVTPRSAETAPLEPVTRGPLAEDMRRQNANLPGEAESRAKLENQDPLKTGKSNTPRPSVIPDKSSGNTWEDLSDELAMRRGVGNKNLGVGAVNDTEFVDPKKVVGLGKKVADLSQQLWETLAKNPKLVPSYEVPKANQLKKAFWVDFEIPDGGGDVPRAPIGVIYDGNGKSVGQFYSELENEHDMTRFIQTVKKYAKNAYVNLSGKGAMGLPEDLQIAMTQAMANPTLRKGPNIPAIPVRPSLSSADTVISKQPANPIDDLPPGAVPTNNGVVILADEKNGVSFISSSTLEEQTSDATRYGSEPPKPPAPPPSPGPEPMPPPPPPGPPPPQVAPVHNVMDGIAKKAGLFEQAKRQLVGAHLRAPLDIASYVSDQQSLKNLEKQWVGTYKALNETAGKAGTAEYRVAIQDAFKGNDEGLKKLEAKADKNPAVKEAYLKIRDMVGEATRKRDENQRWLAEHGYVPDETWAQSEGDLVTQYATREYAAHHLPPGEWAKIIAKDDRVMNNAVMGYMQWLKKRPYDVPTELDYNEARVKLLDALQNEDPAASLFDKNGKGSGDSLKPREKLRFRADLPLWFREVLGEGRDGFLTVAKSLATQDALINNFKIWEGMKAAGQVLDQPVDINSRQLPNNPRLYGVAAGKYVSPEAYDAMVTLPNVRYESDKIIQAMLGFVKTNQVSLGSFRTFLNMFMDNMAGGVLSGGVDVTRPKTTYDAMKFALQSIREHSKNPLQKGNPLVDFIADARRIGVDAPGHIGADITSLQKRQAADAMLAISNEKSYPSMLGRMLDAHSKLGAKGSALVDGIDRVHKLASWKIITDDIMRKNPSMEFDQAMRAAARRVFQSYAMYDRLAPLAERMRSSLVGVAAPYSTFAMERNRIYGSIPSRLLSGEDPGLKWRLLKYGALGTALWGANGLRLFGNVNQDDVDYAMNKRSGGSQEQYSPQAGVWVAPWRDGKGRPAVLDMTQWLGYLTYLKGDQNLVQGIHPIVDSMLTGAGNTAINTVREPLQGGFLGEGMDALAQSAGIKTGFEPHPPNPAYPGIVNAGVRAMRGGLVPRGPMDAYDNLSKTGMVGNVPKTKEPLTPLQAGLRTIPGIPFEQQNTDLSKRVNFIRGIKDAKAIMVRAATLDPERARDPLQAVYEWASEHLDKYPEAKRLWDEAHRRLTKAVDDHQKATAAKNAAKENK